MTSSNEKCWKCGKDHGPRRPTPPIVCTPPLVKVDGVESSKKLTQEQMNQIRELTLKKVFLSVLLISIPILLWKLDSIIMALKA
ncbi:hypothetical protein ABNIH4_19556 [Acinetobacter baumannii ABNIH4]|nr:hypothetical protein ABNIH1_17456 [Acinetobacter baumannii ABNIH1]EGT98754.1 hypothetical protein ABNIH4_19556 [Acinetobacter baumannii ABNIH4]EMT87813.1 hypothetical protein ABNIH25_07052 [Acinetobacter baumannii ABNIH25]EMT94086.1 hypothetical protein ABNIH5_01480 [Acinetobacter baumannii ABNIH5]EMU25608.1 hypothetical protein ABNIH18_18319 [Acinetobacter baumannii ABNIH18]ETY70317.1 hypothetical protein X964_00845 [Acinetobacter baumannii MDR_MMC4]KQF26655.1 hypothetical protein APC06_0